MAVNRLSVGYVLTMDNDLLNKNERGSDEVSESPGRQAADVLQDVFPTDALMSHGEDTQDGGEKADWDLSTLPDLWARLVEMNRQTSKQRGSSGGNQGGGFWGDLSDGFWDMMATGDRAVQGWMKGGPQKGFFDLTGVTLTTSDPSADVYGPAIYGNPTRDLDVTMLSALAAAKGRSAAIPRLQSLKGARGLEIYRRLKENADLWDDGIETIDELLELGSSLAEDNNDPATASAYRMQLSTWRSYARQPVVVEEEVSDGDSPRDGASDRARGVIVKAVATGVATKPATQFPNGLQPSDEQTIVGSGSSAKLQLKKNVIIQQSDGKDHLGQKCIRLKYADGRSRYYVSRYPVKNRYDRMDGPPDPVVGGWKFTIQREKGADGGWLRWTGHNPRD